MEKVFKVFGIKLDALEASEVIERIESWIRSSSQETAKYICVTNVRSVVVAQKDPYMKKITNQSDISVCDGMPLVWAGRLKKFKLKERVSGFTLMDETLAVAQDKGYTNYFYGSTNPVLKKLTVNIRAKYPKLKVSGVYSPPFRPLDKTEKKEVINNINNSGADIVWVGLGYPKQEIWMYEFKGHIKCPVLIGVGAVFDFFSGNKKQAPCWMKNAGLEWFFRLLCEPKRLWKRYLIGNSIFMWLFLKEFVMIKILRKKSDYD